MFSTATGWLSLSLSLPVVGVRGRGCHSPNRLQKWPHCVKGRLSWCSCWRCLSEWGSEEGDAALCRHQLCSEDTLETDVVWLASGGLSVCALVQDCERAVARDVLCSVDKVVSCKVVFMYWPQCLLMSIRCDDEQGRLCCRQLHGRSREHFLAQTHRMFEADIHHLTDTSVRVVVCSELTMRTHTACCLTVITGQSPVTVLTSVTRRQPSTSAAQL